MPQSALQPSRRLDVGAAPSRCAAFDTAVGEAIAQLAGGSPTTARRALLPCRPNDIDDPARCSLAGRVYRTMGEPRAAVPWFDRALVLDPTNCEELIQRALTFTECGDPTRAVADFEKALTLGGILDATSLRAYAVALTDLGQLREALAAYEAAIRLSPTDPALLRAAGSVLRGLGHGDRAVVVLEAALRHAPNDADLVLDYANALHGQERLQDALAVYDKAVAHWPDAAGLWTNRGQVLHDLGRMEEALQSLQTALAGDATLPQAHHAASMVFFRLARFADALASSDRALALRPAYPEALCNRGLTLKMMGRFAEAGACFEQALTLDPDFVYARSNRGELRLLLGDFAGGWPDYEWRFFTERQAKPALSAPVPDWTGQDCAGKRIAVFVDQGNGDTLQFARFLPRLVARGGVVTFVCPARLHRVLGSVAGGVELRDRVEDHAAFDYQIALSSLPGIFETDLATLSGAAPYLAAESQRGAHWARQLGPQGFRIGLCWRGSQNWQVDPRRSVPLDLFAPLAALPGVRLVSLQMPDNTGAETAFESLPVEVPGPGFDSGPDAFVDTAALMMSLDLVITVDTSIAHLAGALGRPVWVLLQAVPEWRWLLGRRDSPWYPSMTLFRQDRLGDWSAPLAHICSTLRDRFGPAMSAGRQA